MILNKRGSFSIFEIKKDSFTFGMHIYLYKVLAWLLQVQHYGGKQWHCKHCYGREQHQSHKSQESQDEQTKIPFGSHSPHSPKSQLKLLELEHSLHHSVHSLKTKTKTKKKKRHHINHFTIQQIRYPKTINEKWSRKQNGYHQNDIKIRFPERFLYTTNEVFLHHIWGCHTTLYLNHLANLLF